MSFAAFKYKANSSAINTMTSLHNCIY